MKHLGVIVIWLVIAVWLKAAILPSESWGIERLERILVNLSPDDVVDSSLPIVYNRDRNALKEFSTFFSRSGWSTNQFVEALIYEMTNGYERGWNALSEKEKDVLGGAIWKLGEINHPMVTNFFRQCNSNPLMWGKMDTFCGMVTYTNLEPEVLDYMRTLCWQTNVYDQCACAVYCEMLNALASMDDALKPAATNRLAKYAYGTLRQLIDFQAAQDTELVKLVPAYSNSVQRLAAMRFIAGTATNTYMRAKATRLVQELSAVPVDELNNLTWLVEE